ncbi:MAG: flippase-like domain-containing protein [Flavobacteriales bacterium]|nr:flippase-like domain-containing protein [Flavobacteriales bacterium]
MKNNWLNIVKKALFPLIGIALIYWAFSRMDDKERFYEYMKSANYFWVILAFFGGALSHFLRALRWKMLIEPVAHNPRTHTTFYAVMGGYLFNFLVPRMGEVSRCVMLSQTDKVGFDKLVGTVFVERATDLLFMLLVIASVLFFQYDLLNELMQEQVLSKLGSGSAKFIVMGAVLLIMAIGAFILFRYRDLWSKNKWTARIFKFVVGLIEGVRSIAKLKSPVLFVVYSVLIWVLYFLIAYWIFFALDETSHLGVAAGLTTLLVGSVAILIPSPGGLGTYHAMVPAGLALYGINPNMEGLAYAFLSHGTQMIMIFLVGGVSVILAGFERRKQY